ncbi:Major facilitator superfamily domain-containing protein 4A [Halotydeus destructor]|nr:Major facilitator superfamily domain-containing protein 4A [Halotydeus destructor]
MAPSVQMKRALSLSLCVSYVAFGLGFSLMGSIVDDMATQLDTNLRSISFAVATRSIANAVCCIPFGLLLSRINRQLSIAGSLVLLSVSMAFIPFVKTITQFHFVQAFYGVSMAALQVAINAFMLEIWKQDSNVYMQILHTFSCVGSVFGPMIAKPYHFAVLHSPTSVSTTTTVAPSTDVASPLLTPFAIGCVIQMVIALGHVAFFYYAPYESEDRDNNEGDADSNGGQTEFTNQYYYTVLSSAAILLCFQGGQENNSGNYLQTFATNVNTEIDQADASYMASIFFMAFAGSRFVSIALALKFSTVIMIWIDVILIIVGNIIIFFCATTSVTGLWIGVIVMGIGFSSCFPGVLSFLEERITVTDKVSGILNCFVALHVIATPFVQGVYLEKFPMIFSYINLVSSVTVLICFGILYSTDFSSNKTKPEVPVVVDKKRRLSRMMLSNVL